MELLDNVPIDMNGNTNDEEVEDLTNMDTNRPLKAEKVTPVEKKTPQHSKKSS